jgi:hypothetical protein
MIGGRVHYSTSFAVGETASEPNDNSDSDPHGLSGIQMIDGYIGNLKASKEAAPCVKDQQSKAPPIHLNPPKGSDTVCGNLG